MATNWESVARQAASAHGIDPDLFANQIRQESGFRTDRTSRMGAQGIAQIMPGTARGWGVDPNDPNAALNAAAKAMRKYLGNYKGDWRKALAAYNAGPGNVQKYGGVPPFKETQNYIKNIMGGKNPQATTASGAERSTVPATGALDPKTQALEFIMKGSPFEGMATARAALTTQPPAASYVSNGTPTAVKRGPVGKDYKWIQQQGQKLFGLRNDDGDSQTTGGGHTAGSEHYDGRAVDFGTAKNSAAQLAKWLKWAKAQGLDAIDEGDHIHVSLPGSGI